MKKAIFSLSVFLLVAYAQADDLQIFTGLDLNNNACVLKITSSENGANISVLMNKEVVEFLDFDLNTLAQQPKLSREAYIAKQEQSDDSGYVKFTELKNAKVATFLLRKENLDIFFNGNYPTNLILRDRFFPIDKLSICDFTR